MHQNWRRVTIGQIGRVVTGKTPPTIRPELYGDVYPFITPTDIDAGLHHVSTSRYLSEEGFKHQKNLLLPPRSVCYTCIASIGKICMTNQPSFTNQQINSIAINHELYDYRFVYYLLLHETERIKKYASGVASPIINKSVFSDIEILVPPLPNQRKIAAVLSAYDDLIENNAHRIQILEEITRTIYHEWFVHYRFPGHEGVKMVETELGLVPEGWERRNLSEISTLFRGKSYRSPELAEEGGYPFLNLKCINRDGGFRRDGLKRFIGKWKPEQSAVPGDIIMAVTDMTQERRIVARAARVPDIGEEPFVMSMDIIKIVPGNNINRAYLYAMLRYSSFPDNVKQHANGVNVLHLNPDRIRDFILYVPTKTLRDQYGEIAEAIFTQCDLLAQKNDILIQTRDLLLPKLVSGELDVSELDI